MSSLLDKYNGVLQKLTAINQNIEKAQQRIDDINSERENDIPARIEKLEEQLTKIDEYMLKIEAFRKLAEKNLESKNVLTIEAPPGYRVNLNRLRQWAMLIDPMSPNDPYAQRVYVVAQCDECFLTQKKAEFTDRIEQLKQDQNVGIGEEIRSLEREIVGFKADIKALLTGREMLELADAVKSANAMYWYESAPTSFAHTDKRFSYIAPGAYALPFDVPKECRSDLKALLGKFYDEAGSRILLPVELDTSKEFAISVLCAPGKTKLLDRSLQNLLLNIIERYPAGQNKIYILDGLRFNSSVLGSLKQLEDSFAIAPIPRNPEQLTATLEQIVSGFADIDDIIELSDSVIEYNESQSDEKRIPRTTIILFGWPNSFEGQDKEYLQRIMTNYERYGISFVSISYRRLQKKEDEEKTALPEYAAQNAIRIRMMSKETLISIGEDLTQRFTWYTLSENLPASYAESIGNVEIKKQVATSVYPERYDCVSIPDYVRTYKKLELPFGIDGKGKEYSASFENENFAAYLVGASRSGKSTLLHTLIAGIIRNYHPDNVELWLADFKQLEFKKYIEHCPPHVKYVLLDESTELVYDLIDKLTDKMMERQRAFARLGKERIDQLDPTTLDAPMPLIFVILDEFSIMSQSIAESEIYRLKLQNLLAKGAALGIRFLFSSQTFTTGIAGLTPTARAQIQQRIAMKGTKEEISETLELSSNLKTEQVRNWMDALPPHYALVKYRISADTLPQVIRVLVMYFPDYALRDDMIEKLNQSMTPVDQYQPTSIHTYVAKHPVLVDGNSYEAFSPESLLEEINKEKSTGTTFGDEIRISLGTPRLMSRMKLVPLSEETKENILMVARASEQMCAMSIVTSVVRSFLLQGKSVEIWAYAKNGLYRMARDKAWSSEAFAGITFSEGIDQVCDSIAHLRDDIREKKSGESLIVLLGIDRICTDFEFVDPSSGTNQRREKGQDGLEEFVRAEEKSLAQKGIIATTPEESQLAQRATLWIEKKGALKKQLKKEGKSKQEIDEEIQKAKELFFADPEITLPTQEQDSKQSVEEKSVPDNQPLTGEAPHQEQSTVREASKQSGAYDATEDFQYVLKQGSRMGYHFMAVFNNFSDIKMSGLKTDWFRHRLSFQISADDSSEMFGRRIASNLPEHICQYSDSLTSYSFRPYLHPYIDWDGWMVDENGQVTSPF